MEASSELNVKAVTINQPAGGKDFPERGGFNSLSCTGTGCESTSCPLKVESQQSWGPVAAFCQAISPCFSGLQALAPKSSLSLLPNSLCSKPPFPFSSTSSCFHFIYYSCFFSIPLNPKPFSIPWHNPPLVFPRRLSVLYPQGSVMKEEAPRPSCSQLGREGGTQMLRGTQKQGCAQNKKKLQLSSGCSVRSERQLESWHCHSCSPRPSPPPGITLLCLVLIFHQRSSGRIQIRLSIVSELGDRREI